MNEAIVRAGERRQQGEEGRLGRSVYWLDHMLPWPCLLFSSFLISSIRRWTRAWNEEEQLPRMQRSIHRKKKKKITVHISTKSWTFIIKCCFFKGLHHLVCCVCLYCSSCTPEVITVQWIPHGPAGLNESLPCEEPRELTFSLFLLAWTQTASNLVHLSCGGPVLGENILHLHCREALGV